MKITRTNHGKPMEDDRYEWKKLSDLEVGHTYAYTDLWINERSKYGPHPVVKIEQLESKVNLPRHLTADCQETLDWLHGLGNRGTQVLLDGLMKFRVREYETKSGYHGRTVDWIDPEIADAPAHGTNESEGANWSKSTESADIPWN